MGAGGQQVPSSEFSLQTLRAEELLLDLDRARLVVDMRVTVANHARKSPRTVRCSIAADTC